MLTQQEVLDLFEYRDGRLYRKKSGAGFCAGVAGGIGKDGYHRVRVNGRRYLTHRVIFLLLHGFLPAQIDHVDGIKSNNKAENLRAATNAQNCRNRRLKSTNTSGAKNVSWHKPLNKWRVQICVDRKVQHIGYFDDIEAAQFVAAEHREYHHKSFANHD